MSPDYSPNTIKAFINSYNPPQKTPPNGYKQASVLIPFYFQKSEFSLVFMKRPDYEGPHGGQISFPGGGKDSADTNDLDTAVRETEEEFGIYREDIEIWGKLQPQYTTVSKYWVTPFVGLVKSSAEFQPSSDEVERLLIIPLNHLTDEANFSIGDYNWKGFDIPSYLYQYGDDIIWGLTARIVFNLLSLLSGGQESDSHWPPT